LNEFGVIFLSQNIRSASLENSGCAPTIKEQAKVRIIAEISKPPDCRIADKRDTKFFDID
jgi:hypothetical protein